MPSQLKTSGSDDVSMDDAPTSHQPQQDESMMDQDEVEDDEENDGEEEEEEEEEEEVQRVKLLPGSTETAASFEFANEGHTLGNALRYVIMKNPEVEFCAYAIPHPSEAKMNVRIQTYEGTTAIQALEKGLADLQDLCDVVNDKFLEARQKFQEQNGVTA
ncbi:putative DNA-directed RNA polymerases I and III subunit RPAC2 [Podospora australis]|uniref:DNA-directed RNA polymerases I and III subunit RPAC2 n=1 Tax=Podospora australis TaxID=1536484 RepID=A0AAN6X2Q8_9PEZI|nr:putative DNA-directed RNA polymerases I and III subunit RPAC2 [Podospora australis]